MRISIYDVLCEELCNAAALPIHELLSGGTREITRDEMTALARAYEARKDYYNRLFKVRLVDPVYASTQTWNHTIGAHWNIRLKRRMLGPRGNRSKRYFINETRGLAD
jgi:hypothetical protein